MTNLNCSVCGGYQIDGKDLVEHLVDWHNYEKGSRRILEAIARSVEGVQEALDEDKEEEDDDHFSRDEDDDDDSENSSGNPFRGFGGGSFSGGGASKRW